MGTASELKSLFSELADLEPTARAERLAAIGRRDPTLRAALDGLLAADSDADRILARLDRLGAGVAPDAAAAAAPESLAAGPAKSAASTVPERPQTFDPYGLIGRDLAHFRVEGVVGVGGMGVVYRAHDVRLGREVALKLLPPHLDVDPAARQRFLREGRAAAALDHPNIATVYEAGEDAGGRLFHAAALYRGESLRQRLARGPVAVAEAVDIATQVLRGLAHAHAAGVVHRDLKPENLILTAEAVVKIVDFGLATLPGTTTRSSTPAGTAAYMAPEQLRGQPVDARADLWAVGVLLYEMLAGQRPFQGDSDLGLAHRILSETPPALSALRPEVPARIQKVVRSLLQRDPPDRPSSAQAVLEELDPTGGSPPRALGGGTTAFGKHTLAALGWRRWLAGAGSLVVIAGLVLVFVLRSFPPRTSPAALRSLAVLPFENRSPESTSPYIGDDIAEQVLDQLARIEGVRTVARTSSFRFRGKNVDVREIGRELGVAAVLEGSLTATADRIRVRVELVGTGDGYTVWRETYDRPRMDILALQDDIAGAIASALATRLRPANARVASKQVNLAAYDLYGEGRHLWYERTPDSLARAASAFRRAIAADSTYAMAYVGLADVYAMLGSFEYAVSPPKVAYESARIAVRKALQLNPDLGPAHAALANIALNYDRDWVRAEQEFQRALEVSPDYAPAHQWYAFLLLSRGRDQEALRQIEEASQADPLSPLTATARGHYLYFLRRYDQARRALDAALRLDSTFGRAHLIRALVDMQTGNMPAAIARLRQLRTAAPDDPVVAAVLAHALGRSGQVTEARALDAWLGARTRTRYVPPELRGLAALGLGNRGRAMDAIDDAFRERSGGVLYLPVDPLLDPLRTETRFQAMLTRLATGSE